MDSNCQLALTGKLLTLVYAMRYSEAQEWALTCIAGVVNNSTNNSSNSSASATPSSSSSSSAVSSEFERVLSAARADVQHTLSTAQKPPPRDPGLGKRKRRRKRRHKSSAKEEEEDEESDEDGTGATPAGGGGEEDDDEEDDPQALAAKQLAMKLQQQAAAAEAAAVHRRNVLLEPRTLVPLVIRYTQAFVLPNSTSNAGSQVCITAARLCRR